MADKYRRHAVSENGFTLLEMIVAITLVAMMAAGIWSVFRVGTRSWTRGTESIDASQRHRVIQDMIHKQLASAFPLVPQVNGNQTVDSYPIFTGTEKSFSFVSLNSLYFNNSPGLTLVNYSLSQDSEEGGYTLTESEDRYLGQTLDSESSVELGNTVSLFDNLSDCYFEYRNPDTSTTSTSASTNRPTNTATDTATTETWVSEWDGQEKRQLPAAISLTMEMTDPDGVLHKKQIIVPVYATEAYTPTNNSSSRGGRGGISRGGGGRGGGGRGGGGRGGRGGRGRGGESGGEGGPPPFDRGGGGRGGRGGGFGGGRGMPPGGGFGPPGGMPGMPPGGGFGGGPGGGFGPPGGGRGPGRGN